MCERMNSQAPLPEVRDAAVLENFFPTDWQQVIFRNYGMVPAANLGEILGMSADQVEAEAQRMGLRSQPFRSVWREKGYITLLRDNWNLLDYQGLLKLLDCDRQTLSFLLKEDDFLDVKLGMFKPRVEPPRYYPLTEAQLKATAQLRDFIARHELSAETEPFDFFADELVLPEKEISERNSFDRVIYSYFALYGDCLLDDRLESYSEAMLERLRRCGVTGVWMQGLLTKLVEFPFEPSLSEYWEIRQRNLNRLIERCRKYGISVFLYLNEPRCMPNAFFEQYPELKGHAGPQYSALCTSRKEVKDYLYQAVGRLVRAVPGLGGILTITMSENLTNCISREPTNCPSCRERKPEEILSEVNNIMMQAIRDVGSNVRLIANLWGWPEHGFPNGTAERAIALLDPSIEVMCVSETLLPVRKGGTETSVIDYSISNIGPSSVSESLLSLAKRLGHRTWAKIQVNNSWECCTVPYLPVFDLIAEHIRRLLPTGIEGLMMSWTLGGYPSVVLKLVEFLTREKAGDLVSWYRQIYGAHADTVQKAVSVMSQAFTQFPFDLNVLYFAPQNVGCSNLWWRRPSGRQATMVCYPYDDIRTYRGVYPQETLKELFRLTADGFREGLTLLPDQQEENIAVEELRRMAEVCYLNFRSCYLQICWLEERERLSNHCLTLIDEEALLTERLYRIQCQDARIGFEASNHYYYHANTLLEKLWNLECLRQSVL